MKDTQPRSGRAPRPGASTHLVALAALTLILASPAAVPIKWTVETSRVQPVVFDVVHGESIALEAALQSYGKPLPMTGKPVALYWQTNGMDSAWWSASAEVRSTNVLAATFTPAMDPGASTVTAFLGATGDIYRAAFTLRFRKGPGAVPNVIEQPPRILDLAHTTVINPPWPTQADFAATTTVMKADLKTYVDDQIEGAGLVSPQFVTNTVTGVVTKQFVEGLGIESGLDTNAVREIASSAGVTNAGALAYADETFLVKANPNKQSSTIEWGVFGESESWLSLSGIFKAEKITANCIRMEFDAGALRFTNETTPYQDSSELTPDNTPILTEGLGDARYAPTSTAATVATQASQLSQLSQSVGTMQSQVSAIGAHLNAEDAHFVSTNYDSVVNMPEAYVEIKMASGGSNNWITIWKEMTRWNRFLGTDFGWNAWQGFHAFETNVTTELAMKADRAWGAYDSETGGWSPEGYTQISSSNILIAAGMSYQRTVTTGGAVWVLQCNSGTAHIGGDTNGFFRIQDGDGVTQFEIIKGNKQEIGADATGITPDNSTIPTTLTIPYSVEAAEHPTIQVCTDLALADWKAEDNAQCAATVAWSGSSGAYVATVQAKSVSATKLFVKATYMSGGETYIHNIAPVGMDSIILNGTKYYLGTAVISGNTVLTLSTTRPNN